MLDVNRKSPPARRAFAVFLKYIDVVYMLARSELRLFYCLVPVTVKLVVTDEGLMN